MQFECLRKELRINICVMLLKRGVVCVAVVEWLP